MVSKSTCVGIFVVVVAVLFSSPPTKETDFRRFLIKSVKKDEALLAALTNPLESLRRKLLPVKMYSIGCSSLVYYDKHYFVGFKKNWINLGSLRGLKKSLKLNWKKMTAEEFSSLFIGCNIFVFILWQFSFTRGFVRKNFLCSMENIKSGRIWCILLNNVSHQELFHLAINMSSFYTLFPVLWSRRSIRNDLPMIMLGTGLAGTFTSLFYFNFIKGWNHQLHGASAIVSGMTVLVALIFPSRIFLVYGFPVRSVQFLFLQLLIEVYRMANVARIGVDFASHIGGMMCAYTYYSQKYH